MFYNIVKAAYEKGKIRVHVVPVTGGDRVIISGGRVGKSLSLLLTKMERQKLALAVRSRCSKCRCCGMDVPTESFQGVDWHRMCASCYPKDSLTSSPDDSLAIAIRTGDSDMVARTGSDWLRAFPFISSDGNLAMWAPPMMAPFVLLPNGSIRARPEGLSFEHTDYPKELLAQLESTFILSPGTDIEYQARALFRAYESGNFEVVD